MTYPSKNPLAEGYGVFALFSLWLFQAIANDNLLKSVLAAERQKYP